MHRMVMAALFAAMLTGCMSTPAGTSGPGQHYTVRSSHNGFNGTQTMRFGPYRVGMRFDASELAQRNTLRGVLGALLGCSRPGCGLPRSPQAMPLSFSFAGPAGSADGECLPDAQGMQCDIGGLRMRFDQVAMGFGLWSAQTPFGPLQVESKDLHEFGERRIEWRVVDQKGVTLAVIGDVLQTDGTSGDREPSFSVWMADGHPSDHQALAKIVGTLLAYAWHATST